MTGPVAALLNNGTRLHLQHGPIDLIIGADGARKAAFRAAACRFETILEALVEELPVLRCRITNHTPAPTGTVAQRMYAAAHPHAGQGFISAMAAVAGAVADEILLAMTSAAPLRRAYVNNGGDIALHLTEGETFTAAISGLSGHGLGRITIPATAAIHGIATSGQSGRSLSRGIADSVTVLADTAAKADAAATLIANAVDLPEHDAIHRQPARDLDPDSDLQDRLVVTHVGPLTEAEIAQALASGFETARTMAKAGHITAAFLHLRGQTRTLGADTLNPQPKEVAHA